MRQELHREEIRKAVEGMRAARTLKDMESHQVNTAIINGDLVFQLVSWVQEEREKGRRVMLLGAPFEADAQLVQVSD